MALIEKGADASLFNTGKTGIMNFSWSRFSLRRFCRQGRLGLLVTAHASVGFPTLYETTTSLALVERIALREDGDEGDEAL